MSGIARLLAPFGDTPGGTTAWIVLLPVGSLLRLWNLMVVSTPPVSVKTSAARKRAAADSSTASAKAPGCFGDLKMTDSAATAPPARPSSYVSGPATHGKPKSDAAHGRRSPELCAEGDGIARASAPRPAREP